LFERFLSFRPILLGHLFQNRKPALDGVFDLPPGGGSTRAVRDLIDKIGSAGKDEPTKFFCVHDADSAGSLIAQTLKQATKARAARIVEIIDLGFFPWTALAEGLPRESVDHKSKCRKPVAQSPWQYHSTRSGAPSLNRKHSGPDKSDLPI
jgi:hypothetical protein